MSDDLRFDVHQGIATITLNRPKALNAFSDPMLIDWASALRDCQSNDAVRAVVLTGAGRAFCAGGDMKSMRGWATADNAALALKDYLTTFVHPVARAVEALDKPYLVAVNGAATGAGMDMTLYGDIRFAAKSARFAETYIKVGLVAGDGGAWLLPRLVGITRALEMLWTGDFIDAVEAERIGLVSRVVDDEQLMSTTYEFAERLVTGPQRAIRLMKRSLYQSLGSDMQTALETVSSHMGALVGTADHSEAVSAFLEKRPPKFTDT
ncbi:MAG: enoyl-CoA hydratase/isomerase family protein [Gammaproteobacteria bacterium]|nr:enoyl-CoA hydratase/isomerase family protein [Gammaproteobacteria bacterium]